MTSLNLWGNYLRAGDVSSLLFALQDNAVVAVDTINLGSNRFGPEGVEAIGTALGGSAVGCLRLVGVCLQSVVVGDTTLPPKNGALLCGRRVPYALLCV